MFKPTFNSSFACTPEARKNVYKGPDCILSLLVYKMRYLKMVKRLLKFKVICFIFLLIVLYMYETAFQVRHLESIFTCIVDKE